MKTLRILVFSLMMISAVGASVLAQDNPCGEKATAENPCSKMHGKAFYVNDPMMRNSVTFKSEAPLEDIVGTSNEVTGYIYFDPEKANQGAHGKITVPVASLNTGIPLRDEHLRSADWLNASAYPEIVFEIDKVSKVELVKKDNDSRTYKITADGYFGFNGKRNRTEVTGRVTYLKGNDKTAMRLPGDLLAVRAEFMVPLADYNVKGPSGMNLVGAKVGESIGVTVSFVGSTHNESMSADASNPCGGKAAMNPCGGKAIINPCGGKATMNPCGGK